MGFIIKKGCAKRGVADRPPHRTILSDSESFKNGVITDKCCCCCRRQEKCKLPLPMAEKRFSSRRIFGGSLFLCYPRTRRRTSFNSKTTGKSLLLLPLFLCFLHCHQSLAENVQAPRFIQQPSASGSMVNEGLTKILQCQAAGVPPPVYRWMKDGQFLGNFTSEPFYRIKSVMREDAGEYQCIARNSAGSILSEKAKLTVAFLSLLGDGRNVTVKVQPGRAAVLQLPPLESQPRPAITWVDAEERPLYETKYAVTTDYRLVILDVEPKDAQVYRAHITNTQVGQEETTGLYFLEVTGEQPEDHVPPKIIVGPEDIEVTKGTGSVNLQCIANARPIHHLKTIWKKDEVVITQAQISYTFDDPWNRTLTLTNLDAAHNGVYTCEVKLQNSNFQHIALSANVTVLEKPLLSARASTEIKGEYGRSVNLPCQATGYPEPNLMWYHNTLPLDFNVDARVQLQEDNTLSIDELHPDDAGIYQCVASNAAGEVSAATWIKIKTSTVLRAAESQSTNELNETDMTPSAPKIRAAPQNITVYDGKDAQLPCQSDGTPKPDTTWRLNDSSVIESAGRIQILDNGALLIAAVQRGDAGKYTCIRSNSMGSVNASAFVSILVKTQIIQPPTDTKVILGNKASLLCKVSHDESVPYDLKWYFDQKLMDPNKETRIKVKDDGTLEIREARNFDIGTYVCIVTSPGGNDSRTAKLDVIELPYQPSAVKAEMLPNIPKAVNISWIPGFDGKSNIRNYIIQKRMMREEDPTPDPIVDWVTALTNVSTDKRFIVLTNLKPAMSYQFRVSAVNGVGEGNPSEPSNRVTLPQEPPSASPIGVVGSPRSETSIMVQWQPPLEEDRNGELRGYVIKYNIFGYPEDWKNRTISNEAQRSYIIDGLITWQLYEIKMAAFNDKGVGKFGESIRVRTKEGVPLEAPSDVRAEALSSTTVQVWWNPPNPQMVNGVNQGYKVQVWKGSPLHQKTPFKTVLALPSSVDPREEHSVVVDNLEKYEDYNITVLCFTNPGDGRRSGAVRVKTLQDVPDAVSSFTFEDVKDTSVHVLWSLPTRTNGILLAYTLRYFIKDIPENLMVKNLSATTTDLLVTDLMPSTQYTFDIFAWTEVGPGPSRISTIQSGVPPVLPYAPTKLSVSKVEAFSALLQFTPGFNGNTSITKYTVQAQIGRNGSWVIVYEAPPPDTPLIVVENLIPHMEYHLRLVAHNIVGASPPSEPSRSFPTLQAPPSHPPRSVTVRAMSATALRVRWTPLPQLEWYGMPRGYNITYKMHSNSSYAHSSLLENHNANSFVIENLQEYTEYEVSVEAYNDVGSSTPSPPAIERTRESVPGAGPENVIANETSSTTVVVSWGEVPEIHQNGILDGYKVYYGAKNIPFKFKDIPNNSTFTTTLTELKKYIQYSIQVFAYTRMGDGALSDPPVLVRTLPDVPGPPSNVSFPDVSQTMARMIWDIPEEPNGDILEYRVTGGLEGSEKPMLNESLLPSARTLRATDLESEQYYVFSITARTSVGWGRTATAVVFTTNNRERPQAPSVPQISQSQIQSTEVTFTWTPGRDGFAPLRYYTIQQADESGYWQSIPEKVDPGVSSYTVQNLHPFTKYKFRIQATNDMGPSDWSPDTNYTRTLAGAPAIAPRDVNVLPITTTSVKITWKSLPPETWHGDMNSGGYRIEYHQVVDFLPGRSPSQEIQNPTASELTLSDLVRDRNYEFVVCAFNSQGDGPKSKPQTVYVGEAVPTGEPKNVHARAVSSTEILLMWKPPPEYQQNGELLGYKIFIVENGKPRESEEMEVVPATTYTYTLIDLKMYTLYDVELLAFNPAGDGPRSVSTSVQTKEGIPGPPSSLSFTEITMNSLRVNWSVPDHPNGRIVAYSIAYETALPSESFNKKVSQEVNTTSLVIYNLEEMATYTFHVRAKTFALGEEVVANVTTGPQIGSPEPPQELGVTTTISAVKLSWENGPSKSGPITGYIVESRKGDDERWQRVLQISHGPMKEWAVSYQNLMPSTEYRFRLFTVNSRGISFPAQTSELIVTPSKLVQEMGLIKRTPFYREVWFLVALAAASVVVIILVIAVLCVKSKSYKYKQTDSKTEESRPVLCKNGRKEALKQPVPEKITTGDDGGFATFELRQSRRGGTLRKNTLSRKSAKLPNGTMIAKAPPRPSPASVTYSDEEDLKGYDDNCDSSSLTEKPSEISSTETEATESEPESEKSDPHSFVNHYANVNDTLRQSWKRQRPAKAAYSSYTDSEPEGSVAVSLNGGHIIMNNMAGSRAPLPGFSSFV